MGNFGFFVEVGCPPELVPDGGHPIPLICRGRKRFVRGNIKRTEKERNRAALKYLDRCTDSFLLLGLSWFGRSLVIKSFENPFLGFHKKTSPSGNSKFVLKRIRDNSGTSGEYIGKCLELGQIPGL